jgi:CarD family transcriptional regulator
MADNDNFDFSKGDYVVYPAHGVGQIEGVETQTIAGMQIRLYAITFEKDRMRLKIPVMKAEAAGLRKLSSNSRMQDAIKTLKGKARVRRTMWSRRAQEYELKINSGDPIAIAEVLRDLKRSNDDSEQSYSERQIYQSALERLAREVAAVERITEIKATERLEHILCSTKKPAEDKAPELRAAPVAKIPAAKIVLAKRPTPKAPAAKAPAKTATKAKTNVAKTTLGKAAAKKKQAAKAVKPANKTIRKAA